MLDWGLLISGVPLVIASRAANIFPVAAVVNKGTPPPQLALKRCSLDVGCIQLLSSLSAFACDCCPYACSQAVRTAGHR